MNCREAQRELALHAGEDLGDPQREADVQQHLAQCPACRRRHSGVKTALAALAVTDSSSTFDSVHSLWPAVRRRIAQGEGAALAGPSWQSTTSVVAGLTVCAGLMVSTAMLLRRPVVPEPTATSPGFSMQYDDRSAAYPAGGVVRPVSKKPAEKAAPPGGLMRRIALPEE